MTKELKIGILAVVSIGLLLFGYNFLKGESVFGTNRTLYVEYDNVGGLTPSSSVNINGLRVGRVNDISMQPNGKILVEILITNAEVHISKDSEALIYSSGIMGGKEISIKTNFSNTNSVVSGDYLTPNVQPDMMSDITTKVEPVMKKVDSLLTNVTELVQNINHILTPNTQDNMKNAIAQLNQTLANTAQLTSSMNKMVNANTEKVNTIVGEFGETSKNLNKMSHQLTSMNLPNTVAKAENTIESLNKTLIQVENLMSSINKGQGTAGKLIKDDELYNNLTKASKELKQLLQDLKLNPTRYINISLFGKNNVPYVEPKE